MAWSCWRICPTVFCFSNMYNVSNSCLIVWLLAGVYGTFLYEQINIHYGFNLYTHFKQKSVYGRWWGVYQQPFLYQTGTSSRFNEGDDL